MFVGLPDVWLAGWFLGREKPLHVFGPARTKSMFDYLSRAFQFDIRVREAPPSGLPAERVKVWETEIEGRNLQARSIESHGISRGSRCGRAVVWLPDRLRPEIGGYFRRDEVFTELGEVRVRRRRLIQNVWMVKRDCSDIGRLTGRRIARTRSERSGSHFVGKDLTEIEVGNKIEVRALPH